MKTPLVALFACSGISFALGFALAWKIVPEGAAPPPAATTAPTGNNQVADLWNGRGAPSAVPAPSQPGNAGMQKLAASDEEHRMRERALADPAYLRELIQRYDSETAPDKREMIRSVLATVQTPETMAFFTRQANSGDPARRQEAYAMLQQMAPESPEVRQLLKQALSSEQSPELLAQAVAALRPAPVDPAESAAITAQLGNLMQHADPAVRSQSVLQLAQWDITGASHGRLAQALGDPVADVRQAAIFAVAQSGARNDSLKSALMGIATNGAENAAVRQSALQVLERFPLSQDEYARFNQLRAQVR